MLYISKFLGQQKANFRAYFDQERFRPSADQSHHLQQIMLNQAFADWDSVPGHVCLISSAQAAVVSLTQPA